IEIERNAHLGQYFVVALEREQRGTEHDAAFDRCRSTKQSETADFDRLLKLPGGHQCLAAADEVALRHFQPIILRHPPESRRIRMSALLLDRLVGVWGSPRGGHRGVPTRVFTQAWHGVAAQPLLFNNPPGLAVALPVLDRAGLPERLLR